MTLTAPACPAAQTIPIDVERRVREVPGVNDVKVAVVWDPPWTRDKMSDAAKLRSACTDPALASRPRTKSNS